MQLENKQKLLNFLFSDKTDHYCDDCLSDILKIKPRQQVNQLCNKLKVEKMITREKSQCKNCSKDKLINKVTV